MRVGIDIGGTKTAAVVLNDDGVVLHEVVRLTGYGARQVIETATAVVEELAQLLEIDRAHFSSVGIGIPGVVSPRTGRVSHAVNLGLEGLELGELMAAQLGTHVHVENDVNAAAIGVYHLLDDPDMHSMAYLNLGTGLAAGLVLEGHLWRGSRGVAGEIGHVPVDPNGPICACGQRGCLELVASGSGLARLWPTKSPRPMEALFAAADDGQLPAIEVLGKFSQNVAAAVRILVLSIDVDKVVIGGGLSSVGPKLIESIQHILAIWAVDSPFLASLDLTSRVQLLPAGHSAAAVGAALTGLDDESPILTSR